MVVSVMAVVGMSMAVVRTWDSGVAREQTAWRDSPLLQLDTAVFPTGAKAESLSCSTEAEQVPTGHACKVTKCKAARGEVECVKKKCVCKPGSCLSADKKCASMAEEEDEPLVRVDAFSPDNPMPQA